MEILKGIPASPGVAIGEAFVYAYDRPVVPKRRIPSNLVGSELHRFTMALEQAKRELARIREKTAREMSEHHARIFESHIQVLEDPLFVVGVKKAIRQRLINAEWAVAEVIKELISNFGEIDDETLKDRIEDIRDVGRRVLCALQGTTRNDLAKLPKPVIIFAPGLTPSDTAQLDRENTLGFVTEYGGRTSHAAILARALKIPAIVGVKGVMEKVKAGDLVAIDGLHGEVYINPDPETVERLEIERERYLGMETRLEMLREFKAETIDGERIILMANIELPEEVDYALEKGAEGIGLYRTEFLYLDRDTPPDEEEQYYAYKEVVEKMKGFPVIIRTVDLGGDKLSMMLQRTYREPNPFLGMRSIRICLRHPDFFKTQLRAIYRAANHGNVKIIFPMITGVEEIRSVKKYINQARQELAQRGIKTPQIEIGAMIEVPGAALTVEHILKEVDFISVGTNDLIQYTLAVDRINEELEYLFRPLHPAVTNLLKRTVEMAKKMQKKVSLCGEMAGEPLYTMVLVGAGFRTLSMSPVAIPPVKEIIRSITADEARRFFEKVVSFETAGKAEVFVKSEMMTRFPEIIF